MAWSSRTRPTSRGNPTPTSTSRPPRSEPTTPTAPINVTGPETVEVRWLAGEFGKLLGKPPKFSGTPASTGWLNNARQMVKEFGSPKVPLARMIEWTADWLSRDMATLNKPTHYEVRDGKY
jgi:hypothetical protein